VSDCVSGGGWVGDCVAAQESRSCFAKRQLIAKAYSISIISILYSAFRRGL